MDGGAWVVAADNVDDAAVGEHVEQVAEKKKSSSHVAPAGPPRLGDQSGACADSLAVQLRSADLVRPRVRHPLRTVAGVWTFYGFASCVEGDGLCGSLAETRPCPIVLNGVAFVRTLCAQAGYGFTETSLDEDTLAVDCGLVAPATTIRVQVKCTTRQFTKKRRALDLRRRRSLARNVWEQNAHDLYFVAVGLSSPGQNDWITHPLEYTHHDAIVYWGSHSTRT